jgi:hypothetical protein
MKFHIHVSWFNKFVVLINIVPVLLFQHSLNSIENKGLI